MNAYPYARECERIAVIFLLKIFITRQRIQYFTISVKVQLYCRMHTNDGKKKSVIVFSTYYTGSEQKEQKKRTKKKQK